MLYPLPAVMVSCAREGEKPNIITAAWVGTICSDPAMVSVSIRPERYSYQIIRETGEFVINLTTASMIRAADFCGVRSGRELDKFEACGLEIEEGFTVSAPVLSQSPVSLECRVTEIIPLGSHDMFLADITAVDVDPQYLDEQGKLCLSRSHLAAFAHGEYFELGKKIGSFGFSVRKKRKKHPGGKKRK